MKTFSYELHRLIWREIEIEVRYCPDSFAGHAHLEIESRCRSPLPISETGYRSHFTRPQVIAEFGGPVAFTEALLEEYADSKHWKTAEERGRQYSLL